MRPTGQTPGVYVEEVTAPKPIEGVGTSTAAFIGLAPGGPMNEAVEIPNWKAFERTYSADPNNQGEDPRKGPFLPGAYLAHAVYGFFQNGGGLCYVVRIGPEDGTPPQAALPSGDQSDLETFRAVPKDGDIEGGDIELTLAKENPTPREDNPAPKEDNSAPNEENPAPKEQTEGGGEEKSSEQPPTYRLEVRDLRHPDKEPERYEHLSPTKGRDRNYLKDRVNAESKLIQIEETGARRKTEQTGTLKEGTYMLWPSPELTQSGFQGDVDKREGMGSLAAVDEVTMLCAPDLMTLVQNGDGSSRLGELELLQGQMIDHCEKAGDRMAILDAPPNLSPGALRTWRDEHIGDSKFATLYYPWLKVGNPLTVREQRKLGSLLPDEAKFVFVPPSGHIAGVWARTDSTRGVHKAPANEVVRGAIGLAYQVTMVEQDPLNEKGVNCIRAFPARGIRVWGARTLASWSDPEWRYLNVRRLFNYISESIVEGTQWSVFEPNDSRLWMQLRIGVTNFLTHAWRQGALFGATPAEAFFVKCDEETNPPGEVDKGRVVVEIGIAAVKPAEFVVFRLRQSTAGTTEIAA